MTRKTRLSLVLWFLLYGTRPQSGPSCRFIDYEAVSLFSGVFATAPWNTLADALDNITQMHAADSVASLKTTRVIIARGLSAIKDCDRVIAPDAGKIVEQGGYD